MSDLGAYVIAAGGTGGHIFPGIALADEIRAQKSGATVVFVGTANGLETKIVPAAGYPLELVDASGFVGKTLTQQLQSLSRLPRGFSAARALLKRLRARAVVGVGGYVMVPVLTAARSLRIPTLIHESNAQPGAANRFLNRFATRTAVGLAAANAHFKRPGTVDRNPCAQRVLRGAGARSGRDDAAPSRLRRKPGIPRDEPRAGAGRGACSRRAASRWSTRPARRTWWRRGSAIRGCRRTGRSRPFFRSSTSR